MSKENNIKTYEELLAEIEKLTNQANESAKQDELNRLEATKRLDTHNLNNSYILFECSQIA